MERKPKVSLGEIFRTFLIIGTTGFGGGMAVVSLAERYCVNEKRWLSVEEFLHGLAFSQILGPFSLNICTFVGYYLRGAAGGIVASVAFIFPSFCLISILTWLYLRFHHLPQLESALRGTNPVVIGIIIAAVISMGKSSVKGRSAWVLAFVAFAGAAFFRVSPPMILVLGTIWAFARACFLRDSA